MPFGIPSGVAGYGDLMNALQLRGLAVDQAQQDVALTNLKTQILADRVQGERQLSSALSKLDMANQSAKNTQDVPPDFGPFGSSAIAKPMLQDYQSAKREANEYRQMAIMAGQAGVYDRQQEYQQRAEQADNRSRQTYGELLKAAQEQRKELASAAGAYAPDGSNAQDVIDTMYSLDPSALRGPQWDRGSDGRVIGGEKTKAAMANVANQSMTRAEQLSAAREADRLKQLAITNELAAKKSALDEKKADAQIAGIQSAIRARDRKGSEDKGGMYGNYDSLTPQQQETVKFYATMSIGGDQSWRIGLSRQKAGSSLIKAVDEYVPVMAAQMGLSAADVGTNKAERIATQSALTQITKDVASIKPFSKMLDQNADILKGLATKVIKTDTALANRPINWLQQNVAGDPNVAEFLAQMRLVQTEAARVITNPRLVGQLTDTAREELEAVVNGNMSLSATNRVLDRLKNDSQRRVGLMEQQQQDLQSRIKGMMGGTTPASKAATSTKTERRVTSDGRILEKGPDGIIREVKQ